MDKRSDAEQLYDQCTTAMRKKNATDSLCHKVMIDNEWKEVYASDAYKTVADYILAAAAASSPVGARAVKKIEDMRKRGEVVHRNGFDDIWFSVHKPGVSHQMHLHPGTGLAGTLYLRSSRDSGRIVFFDPRRPRIRLAKNYRPNPNVPDGWLNEEGTPVDTELFLFGNGRRGVSIAPTDGLLLFFPSWVYHLVQVTKGADDASIFELSDTDPSTYRVALSFNLEGSWKDTADLSSIDLYDPNATQLLQQDIIAPTVADRSTWMYSRNETIKHEMLDSLTQLHNTNMNR